MHNALRILDANANRAREALRVMEDAARFLLNDAALAGDLKRLRHDLAGVLATMPPLEPHRDTPHDVGTTLSTPAEHTRTSAAAVATAAGKRLTEALRTLEEYAKLLPPPPELPPEVPLEVPPEMPPELKHGDRNTTAAASTALEQLRYRAYELERRLHTALRHTQPRQWKLCLLLTQSMCTHHPWTGVLTQALEAGLDCVQVREKGMEAGPLVEHVRQVIELVAGRATVIVNDRPDVAFTAGAHGVHLGQTDLAPDAVRRMFGGQLIVGVSTNHLAQARAALALGADYLGLGPMYPTTTVDNKPDIAGPAYARAFLASFPDTPHLAIGGITPGNAPAIRATGIRGLAVSSAICADADPRQATASLLAAGNPETA